MCVHACVFYPTQLIVCQTSSVKAVGNVLSGGLGMRRSSSSRPKDAALVAFAKVTVHSATISQPIDAKVHHSLRGRERACPCV